MDGYGVPMFGKCSPRVELSQVLHCAPLFPPNDAQPSRTNLLRRQAVLWKEQAYDSGLLIRGQALIRAEKWADTHGHELNESQSEIAEPGWYTVGDTTVMGGSANEGCAA